MVQEFPKLKNPLLLYVVIALIVVLILIEQQPNLLFIFPIILIVVSLVIGVLKISQLQQTFIDQKLLPIEDALQKNGLDFVLREDGKIEVNYMLELINFINVFVRKHSLETEKQWDHERIDYLKAKNWTKYKEILQKEINYRHKIKCEIKKKVQQTTGISETELDSRFQQIQNDLTFKNKIALALSGNLDEKQSEKVAITADQLKNLIKVTKETNSKAESLLNESGLAFAEWGHSSTEILTKRISDEVSVITGLVSNDVKKAVNALWKVDGTNFNQ